MQQGRGGMGSHKHGIKGYSGPSPKAKYNRMMEANKLLNERLKPRTLWYESVADAFESLRGKKTNGG